MSQSAPYRPSTINNYSQAVATQREIPLMANAKRELRQVDEHILNAIQDGLQAIHVCVQMSGFDYGDVADHLGIDRGHFTRVMQGTAHFPTRKRPALMEFCGNIAPLQFEAKAMGYGLRVKQADERIRELERQLEAARRAA